MDGLLVIAMNKHRELCTLQSSGGVMLLSEQVGAAPHAPGPPSLRADASLCNCEPASPAPGLVRLWAGACRVPPPPRCPHCGPLGPHPPGWGAALHFQ